MFQSLRLIFLALYQNQNLVFLFPVYVRSRDENFAAFLAYYQRLGNLVQETENVISKLLSLLIPVGWDGIW